MKQNHSIRTALALAAALALSPAAFAQTTVITPGSTVSGTTTVTGGTAVVGSTSVSSTNLAGTISEFSPDTIVVRSETSPEPVRYSYSKTTTYVDDAGAPVSLETVRSGLPVTVYYAREGDRMLANRVVVHRRTGAVVEGGAVVEKRVTISDTPVIQENKTSTTTTTTRSKKDD